MNLSDGAFDLFFELNLVEKQWLKIQLRFGLTKVSKMDELEFNAQWIHETSNCTVCCTLHAAAANKFGYVQNAIQRTIWIRLKKCQLIYDWQHRHQTEPREVGNAFCLLYFITAVLLEESICLALSPALALNYKKLLKNINFDFGNWQNDEAFYCCMYYSCICRCDLVELSKWFNIEMQQCKSRVATPLNKNYIFGNIQIG